MRNGQRYLFVVIALFIGLLLSHVPSGYAASDEPDSLTKIGGKTYAIDIDISATSRWALYATNKPDYIFFYDRKSIVRDNEMVRVWTKLFSPKEGKLSITKKGTILKEINCNRHQIRELEWSTEDWRGEYDKSNGVTKWENIRPESIDEELLNKVCVDTRKRKTKK